MWTEIHLLEPEDQLADAADADPRWSRAESANYWQRWVFQAPGLPPVGLYLGRGVGPTRSPERLKKVDTWPTRRDADPAGIALALKEAVASLQS